MVVRFHRQVDQAQVDKEMLEEDQAAGMALVVAVVQVLLAQTEMQALAVVLVVLDHQILFQVLLLLTQVAAAAVASVEEVLELAVQVVVELVEHF